jgi:hypothetical protein
MDHSALELFRDHLEFMKWFMGAAGSGLLALLTTGATITFRLILVPMRDSYLQTNADNARSRMEHTLALNKICAAVDSTRSHIKVIQSRRVRDCKYPDPPTAQLPMVPKPA